MTRRTRAYQWKQVNTAIIFDSYIYLDNYWALCFGVAPFIDSKTNMFPKCVDNAGMHMIELKYKLSRAGLVQLWGHVEAGTHTNVENDSLKHKKIHKVKVRTSH